MMRSPFTPVNLATIRAERLAQIARLGQVITAAILVTAIGALVLVTFHTALAVPDIIARSAAEAAG